MPEDATAKVRPSRAGRQPSRSASGSHTADRLFCRRLRPTPGPRRCFATRRAQARLFGLIACGPGSPTVLGSKFVSHAAGRRRGGAIWSILQRNQPLSAPTEPRGVPCMCSSIFRPRPQQPGYPLFPHQGRGPIPRPSGAHSSLRDRPLSARLEPTPSLRRTPWKSHSAAAVQPRARETLRC